MTLIYTLPQFLLFFFVYSFLGWVAEVAWAGLRTNQLVNRGFLNGPWCPIYGCGMVTILALLGPWMDHIAVVFFGGMVLTTLIELVGGWALFKLFHARWWDYSHIPGNIGGYICPQFSLMWGVGAVVLVMVVHPLIALPILHLPEPALLVINGLLLMVFGPDVGLSIAEAIGLDRHLQELSEVSAMLRLLSDKLTEVIGTNAITMDELLDEQKLQLTLAAMEGRDNAAELRAQLRELSDRSRALRATSAKLAKERFFGSGRILRAFPSMRTPQYGETMDALRESLNRLADAARRNAEEWKDLWNR